MKYVGSDGATAAADDLIGPFCSGTEVWRAAGPVADVEAGAGIMVSIAVNLICVSKRTG